MIQLYILNHFIKTQKHVDYEGLEKSKTALNELKSVGKSEKRKLKVFRRRENPEGTSGLQEFFL